MHSGRRILQDPLGDWFDFRHSMRSPAPRRGQWLQGLELAGSSRPTTDSGAGPEGSVETILYCKMCDTSKKTWWTSQNKNKQICKLNWWPIGSMNILCHRSSLNNLSISHPFSACLDVLDCQPRVPFPKSNCKHLRSLSPRQGCHGWGRPCSWVPWFIDKPNWLQFNHFTSWKMATCGYHSINGARTDL